MTWILLHVDTNGWHETVGEWSDSEIEEALKNIKNNPTNYIDVIDLISKFLPQPITDVLWHNLSHTSTTRSNIRLNT
jgi:hypothetical protein